MNDTPLTAQEIEEKLDESLDPVLSSRRSASAPARALAGFTRAQQDFVLRWVDIVAKTNAEMGYQFAAHAPEGLRRMDLAGTEEWIIHAMDVYDNDGLYPASRVFNEAEVFAAGLKDMAVGIGFEDVAGILELFVQGLSGRALKLESGEPQDTGPELGDLPWTDSTTLYLPARVARFPERDKNFQLYKAMVAHLWAQTWYGTFHLDLVGACTGFADPAKALRLLHALETVRLDARLAADLPGLHRDLQALRLRLGETLHPPAWAAALRPLSRAQATVEDSCALLTQLYDSEIPPPLSYQGRLFPERVAQTMVLRQAQDKHQLQEALARLAEEHAPQANDDQQACPFDERFQLTQNPEPREDGLFDYELRLNGQPLAPPPEVRALIDSILQDLGRIPDDYLTAAGGGYRQGPAEKRAEDVWKGTYHEEGAFLYHEWDYRRQHYRKHWCVLREIDVHAVNEPFVAETRQKYAPLIAQLRRTFEALRGQERVLKKQQDGDNIDFDALVESYADMRTGRELSAQLFTKRHKLERDIAVMFMVDMSGSTKGWINDAEREALVMLCEALEVLGDRYAIYGFSGLTRKRCELYRVKRFDEPYDDAVRGRIAGIAPQDYTRMGVTIRHLTKLLNQVEARTKLLITLSDGKPDDYDGYRGDYGIEDTRQALIEAHRCGIHPFCITIDETARDYLPHMYGAVNWTLVSDVRRLPVKVADIYRRLTT
jgi:nitric oxide reductase NorD protein